MVCEFFLEVRYLSVCAARSGKFCAATGRRQQSFQYEAQVRIRWPFRKHTNTIEADVCGAHKCGAHYAALDVCTGAHFTGCARWHACTILCSSLMFTVCLQAEHIRRRKCGSDHQRFQGTHPHVPQLQYLSFSAALSERASCFSSVGKFE